MFGAIRVEALRSGALVHKRLANHRLNADLPAALPMIEVDAVLMERAVANLIENAAKYTPWGATISIAARAVDEQMELSVSDDGPGVPDGPSEDLFARFVRGGAESGVSGVGCRAVASHRRDQPAPQA